MIHNARVQLFATALNNVGVGAIIAGIVAPLVDGRVGDWAHISALICYGWRRSGSGGSAHEHQHLLARRPARRHRPVAVRMAGRVSDPPAPSDRGTSLSDVRSLGEIAARTGLHTIACARCERRGRYRLDNLAAQRGADPPVRVIVPAADPGSRVQPTATLPVSWVSRPLYPAARGFAGRFPAMQRRDSCELDCELDRDLL